MADTIFCDNIPMRSSRDREEIESSVLKGLKQKTECRDHTISIFEDPEHFEITVKIECEAGFWSRKFSRLEVEASFIQQAVALAVFTK